MRSLKRYDLMCRRRQRDSDVKCIDKLGRVSVGVCRLVERGWWRRSGSGPLWGQGPILIRPISMAQPSHRSFHLHHTMKSIENPAISQSLTVWINFRNITSLIIKSPKPFDSDTRWEDPPEETDSHYNYANHPLKTPTFATYYNLINLFSQSTS